MQGSLCSVLLFFAPRSTFKAALLFLDPTPDLFGIRYFKPKSEMFITVLFGDSRMEMFNLNCKLINFIHHLKDRCGVDATDCVDLLDSSGTVMDLDTRQHSFQLSSSCLKERQYYVLLRVCRGDDGCRKYIPLLNNFSQSHPELTDLLRKLSNPNKQRERKWRRGQTQRSGTVHPTRSKKTAH